MAVSGGTENSYGKTNILLQTYISRARVENFSLVSDMAYVAQVRSIPFFALVTKLISINYTVNTDVLTSNTCCSISWVAIERLIYVFYV